MDDFGSNLLISAIVVTHNSVENIAPCLASLEREILSTGGEIIIYDNASHDATVNSIRHRFPEIKIIASSDNIGFASANNAAARQAQGRYLLMVNPDLILDEGCPKILVDAYKNNKLAGAVCPRLRHPDGQFQATCRNIPTPRNIFFSRGSWLGRRKPGLGEKEIYTLGDYETTTEVPAAAATCLLVEREFFIKLGGFDERFFMFMEDTDLCVRIGQGGRKIYFVPEAGGVHLWGKGADISVFRRAWYQHLSVWKYFLKYYPNGFSLFLLPAALMINMIVSLLRSAGRSSGRGKR
ncbi:putative Glycosyl transferase, family 2 [Candidatus Zixiibacteriota bacterium]|nr:putative Glycosyl transferase, family 2 [candidate division Zixibacteria bacterium]